MFDNDVNTYWFGSSPPTENNKVIVSFKSPIIFHKLEFIVPRVLSVYKERYQGVCLYLNNVKGLCTPTGYPIPKLTRSGETIVLKDIWHWEVPNVTTVELRFNPIHNLAGWVAELNIYYELQGTEITSYTIQ